MIDPRKKKHVLAALLLGALAAGLVFLFVRTVTIDFRGDAQALSLLRQLKDFDTRRDVEALRITTDFDTAANPSDWSALRARALRDLEKDPARAAVSAQLASIQNAMTEKESAYHVLKAANKASVAARQAADDALVALGSAAGARMRGTAAANAFAPNIERIRTLLRDRNVERARETAPELEARAASLASASGADPVLAEAAGEAEAAVDSFISARNAEAAAWRKFAYTTAGARIELAAQTASLSIERALDERARWLVYLLFYAAALALGGGYLGLRAFATLRALRAANGVLEARTSQRSRDLADTLRRLQDSEAQLVQSEKMSSLGQLLSGVAHEIASPLGLVRDHISSARSAMPDLRAAHDHVEQVMELVAKLRSFARFEHGRVASFNVNDGVQATLLIARPLLRKVDVERTLGDVPAITCSPTQVSQVLLNLVTNAAQALDKPHGRITVTTRPERDAIAIDVADNGKGIASESLSKIFDPFFTTRATAGGTGLGLSIAHKIVARHGGRIDVRSQVGVGSTFTVTLPLQPPQDPIALESNRSVLA
jgi:signal transduction histidine kinase